MSESGSALYFPWLGFHATDWACAESGSTIYCGQGCKVQTRILFILIDTQQRARRRCPNPPIPTGIKLSKLNNLMNYKKNLFERSKRSALLGATLAGLVSALTSSYGASATWNGTTNGTWTTTTNWSASPVPGTGDTATFNNAGNSNTVLDLGAGGVQLRSITFDTASAAAYTIGSGAVGSQTLTLETTGVTQLTSTVVNNQTINANILLGVNATASTHTFTNASLSNSLNVAGNVSGNTGGTAAAKTVTINGAGNTTVSGAISNGGATTVALTKRGAGTLTLSGDNSYTGATLIGAQGAIEGGTVLLSGIGKLGNSAVTLFEGTLDLNSTTQTITSLTVGGGSAASSASVLIGNGTLNLGGGVTFSGANNHVGAIISGSGSGVINLLGDRTFAVADSNIASDDLTISAILANGDATARSINKTGAGTLTLSAANTFTGSTGIAASGGTIKLDFAGSHAPVDDILYNAVAKGALNIAAGTTAFSTLLVQGKSGTTNTQAFGNLTQSATSGFGLASITVNSGSSGTMNLSLGTITRTAGSSIAFTGPASGNITTTQADGRILGATFTSGSSGVTTWAGVTSGTLGAYTGDTLYVGGNISSNAFSNLYIDNTTSGNVSQGAGSTNLATLSFLDAADRTVVVGAGNTLLLSGPAGGVQNISTAGNLTIGAPGNAGSITAGTTGAHEFIITNGSTSSLLTINSVIVNNVGGSPVLNITGPGRTVLTGNNTFTGATNLNGGILEIQNDNALGTTAGATIIAQGATLGLSGGITTAENISINGAGFGDGGVLRNVSGNNTLSGTITVSSGSRINSDAGTLAITGNFNNNSAQTLTFGGAGNSTLANPISTNAAPLIKDGSGTLTLLASGIVATTGAVTVNNGTLRYNANDAIGSGNLTVNGGTFDLSTFSDTVGAVTISAGSIIGSGTLTGTSYTSSDGGTISANLGNTAAALTKRGNGTLTLAGTSAYTGTTTIHAGVLNITGDLTGGTAITLLGPQSGTGGTGSFTQSAASVISGATSITWAGNMDTITSSTLAGNNSYTGVTNVQKGVLRVLHSNALGSTDNGTFVTQAGVSALELAGDISIGAEALSINGTGISNGGVLRNISGNNSYGGAITIGGATTRINSDDGTLTLTGNITSTNQALIIGGAGNTAVTSTIALGNTAGTLTKDGTGTLTLSGSNTYTGNTTGSAGTLQFASTASLYNGVTTDWTAAKIRVNSGATVAFNVGGSGEFSTANVTTLLTNLSAVNSNGLNAGSSIAFDTTNATGGTFTIADNIADSVGTGGGAVGLTKLGTGTLNLSGSNGYTGTTAINAGTLLISGTAAINSTSGITVNNGGTLSYSSSTGLDRNVTLNSGGTFIHNGSNAYAGTLTWNGGTLAGNNFSGVSLTVGANKTLSPGNSPGTMETASQTWENGGNYNLQIFNFAQAAGTGFDTIDITGTLDLTAVTAGGFNINLWSLSAIGPDVDGDALNFNNMTSGSWLILSTTGGISGFDQSKFTINVGAINGTAGFSNDLGGGTFSVSHLNDNLYLEFTAIPEPSAWMLLGAGLAVVLLRKRRRKSDF